VIQLIVGWWVGWVQCAFVVLSPLNCTHMTKTAGRDDEAMEPGLEHVHSSWIASVARHYVETSIHSFSLLYLAVNPVCTYT